MEHKDADDYGYDAVTFGPLTMTHIKLSQNICLLGEHSRPRMISALIKHLAHGAQLIQNMRQCSAHRTLFGPISLP